MRIGNRLFPYPVLNCIEDLSDYEKYAYYSIEFERDENGYPFFDKENLILKNLRYNLFDEELANLMSEGKVKAMLVVESSASIFREKYEISAAPSDLKIPLSLLSGTVIVSSFIYATEDIIGYKSKNFLPEYDKYSFDIEKYSILAADDGFKLDINIDTSKDNKVSSIFTIVKVEREDKIMSYENSSKEITIRLPVDYFNAYETFKSTTEMQSIAFAMIAIPPLCACLEEIRKKQFETMDDAIEAFHWFKSVINAYKKVTDKELSIEEFNDNISLLELSQLVLNDASCNGIMALSNIEDLFNNRERGEENE